MGDLQLRMREQQRMRAECRPMIIDEDRNSWMDDACVTSRNNQLAAAAAPIYSRPSDIRHQKQSYTSQDVIDFVV